MGRPVKYNIVGVGNLIGPQVYITASGAVYILFGFGKKQGWLWLLLPWCRCPGSCETGAAGVGSFPSPLQGLSPTAGHELGFPLMRSLERDCWHGIGLITFPSLQVGPRWGGIRPVSPAQNPTLGDSLGELF